MSDEEFEKRKENLIAMLDIFRNLKEKRERQVYRSIIRKEIVEMTQV